MNGDQIAIIVMVGIILLFILVLFWFLEQRASVRHNSIDSDESQSLYDGSRQTVQSVLYRV